MRETLATHHNGRLHGIASPNIHREGLPGMRTNESQGNPSRGRHHDRPLGMGLATMAVAISLSLGVDAGAATFDAPWKEPGKALAIDAFEGNDIKWDKLATEPRVAAVIHRSTMGRSDVDSKYKIRREEAKKRGYLWGSFHLGFAGHGKEQADHYIDTVQPAADEVMALDVEDLSNKRWIGIADAELFVEQVKKRTGRYPILYLNHDSASLIAAKHPASILAKLPLWYVRYLPKVTDFPKGAWPTYTLWQFSSEWLLQMPLPGVDDDMDVDVFDGSADQLKQAWPFTRPAP
jgi:GH25 family lysozyme M1 (1,4-beta-N-acetylmuramidase)